MLGSKPYRKSRNSVSRGVQRQSLCDPLSSAAERRFSPPTKQNAVLRKGYYGIFIKNGKFNRQRGG